MIKNIAEFMTEASSKYFSKLELTKESKSSEDSSVASELFSEIVGDWIIKAWYKNACPNPIQLVELGGGSGGLMKKVIQTIKTQAPDMYRAMRIVIVAHNPELVKIQKKTLAKEEKLKETKWITDIRELPFLPFIMVANEFFNSLPIHQIVKTESGFKERLIDSSHKFVLSQNEPNYLQSYMAREHIKAIEGSIIEVCPYASSLISYISDRMNSYRSSVLIIDYGYEEPQTIETLEAMKEGKKISVLKAGEEDGVKISSHVDFSALRAAALQARASVYGPLKQGIWLKKMNIEEKATQKMSTATLPEKREIHKSVQKLISFNKLGNSFKVMVMFSRF